MNLKKLLRIALSVILILELVFFGVLVVKLVTTMRSIDDHITNIEETIDEINVLLDDFQSGLDEVEEGLGTPP